MMASASSLLKVTEQAAFSNCETFDYNNGHDGWIFGEPLRELCNRLKSYRVTCVVQEGQRVHDEWDSNPKKFYNNTPAQVELLEKLGKQEEQVWDFLSDIKKKQSINNGVLTKWQKEHALVIIKKPYSLQELSGRNDSCHWISHVYFEKDGAEYIIINNNNSEFHLDMLRRVYTKLNRSVIIWNANRDLAQVDANSCGVVAGGLAVFLSRYGVQPIRDMLSQKGDDIVTRDFSWEECYKSTIGSNFDHFQSRVKEVKTPTLRNDLNQFTRNNKPNLLSVHIGQGPVQAFKWPFTEEYPYFFFSRKIRGPLDRDLERQLTKQFSDITTGKGIEQYDQSISGVVGGTARVDKATSEAALEEKSNSPGEKEPDEKYIKNPNTSTDKLVYFPYTPLVVSSICMGAAYAANFMLLKDNLQRLLGAVFVTTCFLSIGLYYVNSMSNNSKDQYKKEVDTAPVSNELEKDIEVIPTTPNPSITTRP